MLNQVHKQLTTELKQNTRTDTIFILTAIFLNLISLSVNAGMVGQSRDQQSVLIVMFLFVALVVLVNVVVIFGLMKGKQTRTKLLDGLIRMYQDQGVDKYYDSSLLSNYQTRYYLFMMVVVFTGLIAIIVPFILR
jgi:hypothetical protein